MRAQFYSLIFIAALGGCAELPEHSALSPQSMKSLDRLSIGDGVELALADLSRDMPHYSYENLLSTGAVVENGRRFGSRQLDVQIRSLLLSSSEFSTDSLDDIQIHVHRIKLNNAFRPMRLIGRWTERVLPFTIKAGGEIEFAYAHDPSHGEAIPRFSLMDVPTDAESALALPVGTVVTIPIQGRVLFDVSGQFLVKSLSHVLDLKSLVMGSAFGHTSSVRTGTLIGDGQFVLQLARLADDKVRLRLVSSSRQQAAARLGSYAHATVNYTFLPSAPLDQLRGFRRRFEQTRGQIRRISQVDEQIENLRDAAPGMIKSIFDAVPIVEEVRQSDIEKDLSRRVDRILEQAERMIEPVEAIESYIRTRVEEITSTVVDGWRQKLVPVLKSIRRWSSRGYSLAKSITLSDELSRRLTRLADYEFDLRSEEATTAFERAISGQTIWNGLTQALSVRQLDVLPFTDFTLADTMANVDLGHGSPRVRRLATAGKDMRARRYRVAVDGFGLKAGLNGEFDSQRIMMTDENGRTQEWNNQAWERGQHSDVFGQLRSESFASGAFTHAAGGELETGGYWFRWTKQYAVDAAEPTAHSFRQALNDLGPFAVRIGLPQAYGGETAGAVDATLSVVINGASMDALFDPNRTPDELLWRVLGDMMSRYQRPTFLPYAHAPIRPNQVYSNEVIRDACEAVARRLGGRYCYSFVDRIFPALREAQASSDPDARLAFFESFYRVPLGGAVLSTRFLVRYLVEVLDEIGQTDAIHVNFQVNNRSDDSSSASPSFSRGDDAAHSLMDTTDLSGIF
ncbi:MAG: hypothetical protein CMH52_11955 [Myxococcales bacterium]|nr:hypothetical protein [Myxococcales bacterium]